MRFARWFTLIVPVGMAMTGLTIGEGKAAYASSIGQALVAVALFLILGAWLWAGKIMKMPTEDRVFS